MKSARQALHVRCKPSSFATISDNDEAVIGQTLFLHPNGNLTTGVERVQAQGCFDTIVAAFALFQDSVFFRSGVNTGRVWLSSNSSVSFR